MSVDWTKPIQTKRGEPAILVYTYSDQVTTHWPRVCVMAKEPRTNGCAPTRTADHTQSTKGRRKTPTSSTCRRRR